MLANVNAGLRQWQRQEEELPLTLQCTTIIIVICHRRHLRHHYHRLRHCHRHCHRQRIILSAIATNMCL